MVSRVLIAVVLISLVWWGIGCTQPEVAQSRKYSIHLMGIDGREYLYPVNDLSSGEIRLPAEAIPMSVPKNWYNLMVKDGYYYLMNRKSGYLVRYVIDHQRLVPSDSVSLSGFSFIDTFEWIHPDSLFLLSYNRKTTQLLYAKINVRHLNAKVGSLPLSLPAQPYNSMTIGFSHRRAPKLFVGFTYHQITGISGKFTTSDTTYVGELDYASMTLQHLTKDTRSTFPGGNSTAMPNTFTDETGDFYFLECPGEALGNHPTKPTAILRIRANDTKIDSSYFFNISTSSIRNHAYGMWYIGNGKALVRNEQKGLFTDMSDHYKVPHFQFQVIDLQKRTVEKLNLPLDKGTSRQCVLVENGLVYISVNSPTEGNYIWLYNPSDGTLKKGLKFPEPTEYILRMERLYESPILQ